MREGSLLFDSSNLLSPTNIPCACNCYSSLQGTCNTSGTTIAAAIAAAGAAGGSLDDDVDYASKRDTATRRTTLGLTIVTDFPGKAALSYRYLLRTLSLLHLTLAISHYVSAVYATDQQQVAEHSDSSGAESCGASAFSLNDSAAAASEVSSDSAATRFSPSGSARRRKTTLVSTLASTAWKVRVIRLLYYQHSTENISFMTTHRSTQHNFVNMTSRSS
jgi:hypothetical protein